MGNKKKRKLSPEQQEELAIAGLYLHPGVADRFGVSVIELYRAMVAAGPPHEITKQQSKRWKQHPEEQPAWFTELLHKRLIEEEQQVQKEREQQERDLYTTVNHYHGAKYGRDRAEWRWAEEEIHDAYFWINKRWINEGEVTTTPAERAVCKALHVDPQNHSTWLVHAGRCEGQGADCGEGIIEAEVERAREAIERKEERAEQSAENKAALTRPEFAVGKFVLCWDKRIGRIIKHNRVSAKVEITGGPYNNHQIDTKAVKPYFMQPWAKPFEHKIGDVVPIRAHGRLYQATITSIDAPFFQATWTLKNKQQREQIFGFNHVVDLEAESEANRAREEQLERIKEKNAQERADYKRKEAERKAHQEEQLERRRTASNNRRASAPPTTIGEAPNSTRCTEEQGKDQSKQV